MEEVAEELIDACNGLGRAQAIGRFESEASNTYRSQAATKVARHRAFPYLISTRGRQVRGGFRDFALRF